MCVCINAMINDVLKFFFAVQIYDLSYIHLYQKNTKNKSLTYLSTEGLPLNFSLEDQYTL